MRKLRTLFTLLVVSMCTVQSAWAQEEQTISVTLRESGGLSAEIFAAQVAQNYEQSLATVVHLTIVSGELNATDWTAIQSMDALKTLNMSGTSNTEIPENQFRNKCASLETVTLPSQLEVIGDLAFFQKANLTSVVLPSTVTSVGSSAFSSCSNLETVGNAWPSGATEIPLGCFQLCGKLQPFTIPEGVTSIGSGAFSSCSLFKSTIPSTVKSIGSVAFKRSSMEDIDVVLSEGISLGLGAFESTKIKSIVFPASYYKGVGSCKDCSNLKDVTFLSPTVITGVNSSDLPNNDNLTLHVPSHLVNAYKADSYFSSFNVVGFDITEYSDMVWPFNQSFALNSYIRMAGTPKISLANSVNFTVSGDDAQQFGGLTVSGHTSSSSSSNNDWSQILSTCNNVTVTGDYSHKVQTYGKKWYFMCLPFDVDINAIETEDGAKYAIRYYDGESRATNNSAEGNWKNCSTNIPAGMGFIYQTSATTWTTFKAVANDKRSNVFKNEELTTALAANATSGASNELSAANKGWNLVGNPWQCYYNIHKLNYTAPISVRNGSTYVAYSIQDDDIALEPNQAFFVQCPDEVTSIGFPTDGRQLTSEVIAQSSREVVPSAKSRWLVDVQIANNEEHDKTRLVVNNAAGMDYELTCDAAKLMSWDGTVPQIYSIDADDTQYAINERPLENGTLRLGMVIKEGGQYTISAVRNDVGQVLLIDRETGLTTDLSQNGYCFNAEAGTFDNRFMLSFMNSELTGIKTIDSNQAAADNSYFNLSGQRIEQPKKGVNVVKGKKMIVK